MPVPIPVRDGPGGAVRDRVILSDRCTVAVNVPAELIADSPHIAFARMHHEMSHALGRAMAEHLELECSSLHVESSAEYDETGFDQWEMVRRMPRPTTYIITGLTTTGTPVTLTSNGTLTISPNYLTNTATVTFASNATTVDYYLTRPHYYAAHDDYSYRRFVDQAATWTARDEAAARRRTAAHERRRTEQERRRDRDAATAREATERATALLRSVLTPAQCAELDADERITVVGSHGNRFRVDTRHLDTNIAWIDADGETIGTLCAHPAAYDSDGFRIPTPDLLAGQVLALQTDEAALLAVANTYGPMPRYDDRPARRVITAA
jgi:hypothetical protein